MVVCDWFDVYKDGFPTGEKEYLASHAVDVDTGKNVIVQCIPPAMLGATRIGDEWYLEDKSGK